MNPETPENDRGQGLHLNLLQLGWVLRCHGICLGRES